MTYGHTPKDWLIRNQRNARTWQPIVWPTFTIENKQYEVHFDSPVCIRQRIFGPMSSMSEVKVSTHWLDNLQGSPRCIFGSLMFDLMVIQTETSWTILYRAFLGHEDGPSFQAQPGSNAQLLRGQNMVYDGYFGSHGHTDFLNNEMDGTINFSLPKPKIIYIRSMEAPNKSRGDL